MNLEIKGLEALASELDKLVSGIDGDVKQIVQDEAQSIADEAKNLAPVDAGRLRESIQTRVIEENGEIAGEVYTNLDYAAYVEFGTGPVGQAAGLKIDGINLRYRQTPWAIPADKIDASVAEKYHFIKLYDEDGEVSGYLTRGQAPQPFLYPAMQSHEDEIKEKLGTAINMHTRIKE